MQRTAHRTRHPRGVPLISLCEQIAHDDALVADLVMTIRVVPAVHSWLIHARKEPATIIEVLGAAHTNYGEHTWPACVTRVTRPRIPPGYERSRLVLVTKLPPLAEEWAVFVMGIHTMPEPAQFYFRRSDPAIVSPDTGQGQDEARP